MVKMSAFYDAWFGCYATNRQMDRIPEFNTSLIGRGKKKSYVLKKHIFVVKIIIGKNYNKIFIAKKKNPYIFQQHYT
jgi:hypothetical protein